MWSGSLIFYEFSVLLFIPLLQSGDAMLQACGHALHSVTQFILIKVDQQKSEGVLYLFY